MPLDQPGGPALDARIDALNAQLHHHSATDVLRVALKEVPDLALVSSFGAESVVLLHLVAVLDPQVPVLFIDTEMLFTETLVYQQEVAERLGLRNLRILRAKEPVPGDLHRIDPDACCQRRKVTPLVEALAGHGGWITGRKRYQSGTRAQIRFFEPEAGTGRIKVNPLAYWQPGDVADYIAENRLPRHPLVARGYPSIGCAPCTSPIKQDEDPRAGRWGKTTKTECGIHFGNGKPRRTGEMT